MAIKGSENDERVKWLTDRHTPEALLDIGSGIGVFPYAMREKGVHVWCTEENTHSLGFINGLGIKCVKGIPYYAKFEMVSIVHVLEHIQDPVSFLKDLKKVLHENGRLFVEVPDAEAFNELDLDHDDFNSCHTHAYDVSTLYQMLRKAKFDVVDIHRASYPERKLKRIRGICKLNLPKT
jgi:SAM-dependent methyltransferase